MLTSVEEGKELELKAARRTEGWERAAAQEMRTIAVLSMLNRRGSGRTTEEDRGAKLGRLGEAHTKEEQEATNSPVLQGAPMATEAPTAAHAAVIAGTASYAYAGGVFCI